MTDKDKLINLLKEFGINETEDCEIEGFVNYEDEIYLTPCETEKIKIIGYSWTSVSFYFNKDGSFINMGITGD